MELTSKGVNKQFIDLHLVIIASGKKKTTISIPFAPVQRRVFGCFFLRSTRHRHVCPNGILISHLAAEI